MTAKELFARIMADLMQDPYLSQFKFTKSYSLLSIQEGDVRKSIELEHWTNYDEFCVRPTYGVKFDSLNKWFTRFDYKSRADQIVNSDAYYGEIEGLTRADWNIYSFLKDGKDYDESIDLLRVDLVNCSKYVFDRNDTLQKVFEQDVMPILDGRKKLGICTLGSNWIFMYLKLCRMVSPDDYPRLKTILMDHFEFMKNRGEPNILKYKDNVQDILDCLETT